MMSKERDYGRKGKAFYVSTFNSTFSCFLNKGPHIFILHWAPLIMYLVPLRTTELKNIMPV